MLRAVLPRFQWIPSIMTCQFSQAPEGDAGWTMAKASSRRWWQISPSTDQRETRSSFQHVGRRCISRTDPLPQSRFKSVDSRRLKLVAAMAQQTAADSSSVLSKELRSYSWTWALPLRHRPQCFLTPGTHITTVLPWPDFVFVVKVVVPSHHLAQYQPAKPRVVGRLGHNWLWRGLKWPSSASSCAATRGQLAMQYAS